MPVTPPWRGCYIVIFFKKKYTGTKGCYLLTFQNTICFLNTHRGRLPRERCPIFFYCRPLKKRKTKKNSGWNVPLGAPLKINLFWSKKHFMLKRTSKNKNSQRAAGGPGQFFFENLNIAAFSKILIFWVKQSKIGFFGPSLFYKMLRVVVLV